MFKVIAYLWSQQYHFRQVLLYVVTVPHLHPSALGSCVKWPGNMMWICLHKIIYKLNVLERWRPYLVHVGEKSAPFQHVYIHLRHLPWIWSLPSNGVTTPSEIGDPGVPRLVDGGVYLYLVQNVEIFQDILIWTKVVRSHKHIHPRRKCPKLRLYQKDGSIWMCWHTLMTLLLIMVCWWNFNVGIQYHWSIAVRVFPQMDVVGSIEGGIKVLQSFC
jgi:hypothetical protein